MKTRQAASKGATAAAAQGSESIIGGGTPGEGFAFEDAEAAEFQAEMRAWTVQPADHGQRLDKWLAQRCPEFSRQHCQWLLEQGAVRLGDAVVRKPATRLKVGERVSAELRPTAAATAFQPEPMDLRVVYEDAHLALIDKPVGLVVHPAAGHWSGTLLNGLLARHPGAATLPRAGIVHRLDKDTSGLMVVGKTAAACEGLVRLIAAREAHRVYLALAHGRWQGPAERRIDAAIGRDPRQRLRMAVLGPAGGALAASLAPGVREARTDVRCLASNASVSLLACKLHTGRTHQIRVHLAHCGHPLVGDALYGGRPLAGLQRQALHAWRLWFKHPVTGQGVAAETDLPSDLSEALATLALDYNPSQVWGPSSAEA